MSKALLKTNTDADKLSFKIEELSKQLQTQIKHMMDFRHSVCNCLPIMEVFLREKLRASVDTTNVYDKFNAILELTKHISVYYQKLDNFDKELLSQAPTKQTVSRYNKIIKETNCFLIKFFDDYKKNLVQLNDSYFGLDPTESYDINAPKKLDSALEKMSDTLRK